MDGGGDLIPPERKKFSEADRAHFFNSLDYITYISYNKTMRKISLSGFGAIERIGADRFFALASRMGFDAIDFALYQGNKRLILDLGVEGSPEEQGETIRRIAERHGLVIGQTHAPFGFRAGDAPEEEILEVYRNAARATRALGASKMVVHPIKFDDCANGYRQQECFDLNLRVFERLGPTLRECGVKAMLENMFITIRVQNVPVLVRTIYSTGEELARAADALGEEFGVCLDSGHALITGEDIPETVRAIGNRLGVLHLHDNDHERDDHLPPYLGELDFDALMRALKEVGYSGNINFEVDFVRIPEELLEIQMRYLHEVGLRFRRILDGE